MLLILFMTIFGLTLGPIVWMYVPEIIPAKTVPMATMMNWMSSSTAIIMTPFITKANGNNPFPVFFILGTATVLLFFVNLALMVETKGLTRLQITNLFRKKQ